MINLGRPLRHAGEWRSEGSTTDLVEPLREAGGQCPEGRVIAPC
jgi:hypothetical protein